MPEITDTYLAELEALCGAATKGPWKCVDPMKKDKMEVYDAIGQVCKTDMYGFVYPESFSNGEFIAAARTALPALIAEVKRLRADFFALINDALAIENARIHSEEDIETLRAENARLKEKCEALQVLVEKLGKAAADYIGDESAGSMEFWDLYHQSRARLAEI